MIFETSVEHVKIGNLDCNFYQVKPLYILFVSTRLKKLKYVTEVEHDEFQNYLSRKQVPIHFLLRVTITKISI